jgi:hypothetical protein
MYPFRNGEIKTKIKFQKFQKNKQTFLTEQSFVKGEKESVFIQGFYFYFLTLSLQNELKIEHN